MSTTVSVSAGATGSTTSATNRRAAAIDAGRFRN